MAEADQMKGLIELGWFGEMPDPNDEVGLHAVTCEFTGEVCECLNCKRTEPCRYRIESSQHGVPRG